MKVICIILQKGGTVRCFLKACQRQIIRRNLENAWKAYISGMGELGEAAANERVQTRLKISGECIYFFL